VLEEYLNEVAEVRFQAFKNALLVQHMCSSPMLATERDSFILVLILLVMLTFLSASMMRGLIGVLQISIEMLGFSLLAHLCII
jgi:hypothetical protein